MGLTNKRSEGVFNSKSQVKKPSLFARNKDRIEMKGIKFASKKKPGNSKFPFGADKSSSKVNYKVKYK